MFHRHFRLTLALAPALLLIAAAIAGCGGDDNGGSSPTTKPAGTGAATTKAAEATIPVGAPQITQKDLAFVPNKITVKAGEKLYFHSGEAAIHTVNIDGKNISGNMKEGQVVVFTPPKAGTYKVSCDYHPQMSATITVE